MTARRDAPPRRLRSAAPEHPTRRRAMAAHLVALLALAACGEGFEGSFQDELGMTRYDFAPDGSGRISAAGMQVEGQYEIKDDRIVVQGPHGTLVLRRDGNTLHGPMGLVLHTHQQTPGDSE